MPGFKYDISAPARLVLCYWWIWKAAAPHISPDLKVVYPLAGEEEMAREKEGKGATQQTVKHKNARAFIVSAGFGNHGNLQTALEGQATRFLLASQTAHRTNAE